MDTLSGLSSDGLQKRFVIDNNGIMIRVYNMNMMFHKESKRIIYLTLQTNSKCFHPNFQYNCR